MPTALTAAATAAAAAAIAATATTIAVAGFSSSCSTAREPGGCLTAQFAGRPK